MMTPKKFLLLLPLTGALVAACHGGHGHPAGQVVAVVDGREVTVAQLQSETAVSPAADPSQRKAAQQVALAGIVNRMLIADAAKKQGLDKRPAYSIAMQRASDTILVEMMEQKMAGDTPEPTMDEVQRFINENPAIFSDRRIMTLDQVQFPRPATPELFESLKKLKTLDEIQAFLTANKIPSKRQQAVLDAVGADPRLIEGIVKLPDHEVFIVGPRNVLSANEVVSTKIEPFTGDVANKYASSILKKMRTNDSVGKQIQSLVSMGSGKVTYNSAYAPAKPTNPQISAPSARP